MAPEIIDDKSSHCIPFILSRRAIHASHSPTAPFFIGINGVQGAGKTTLVSALFTTLRDECKLETLVLSLDDLYLTHSDQVALAQAHPSNPLIQHRGEPGTHDIPLATALFANLRDQLPAKIPQYDKAAFSGQGDRVPSAMWREVNQPQAPKVQVVILEGWSVGFHALPEAQVVSRREMSQGDPNSTLWKNSLESLLFVNERLKGYDVMTNMFDAFIHIDAEETAFVYSWRREQEEALRVVRGVENAMTDEQVVRFVDGYYPAYELFTEDLRKGVFREDPEKNGSQLRLVVGRDRRVKSVEQI